MSTGTAPLLLLDLATSTIADRRRSALKRGRQASARRGRLARTAPTR